MMDRSVDQLVTALRHQIAQSPAFRGFMVPKKNVPTETPESLECHRGVLSQQQQKKTELGQRRIDSAGQ